MLLITIIKKIQVFLRGKKKIMMIMMMVNIIYLNCVEKIVDVMKYNFGLNGRLIQFLYLFKNKK